MNLHVTHFRDMQLVVPNLYTARDRDRGRAAIPGMEIPPAPTLFEERLPGVCLVFQSVANHLE